MNFRSELLTYAYAEISLIDLIFFQIFEQRENSVQQKPTGNMTLPLLQKKEK